MNMKYTTSLAFLAAATLAGGCSNNAKKPPTASGSVTDIRPVAAAPAPVQPIQPMQPVQPIQPVIADTAPVATNTAVASATPAIAGNTYVIQKGDTLFKIARAKYGDASAVKKIKEANPGLDPNHIKVGQKINLP